MRLEETVIFLLLEEVAILNHFDFVYKANRLRLKVLSSYLLKINREKYGCDYMAF